jgi:hypothetical protein
MKVGVTGHQKRVGIDWHWVRQQVDLNLDRLSAPLEGYSSLAEGSDQVFAEAMLDRGGTVVAIIPISDYERFFAANALLRYRKMLTKCQAIEMASGNKPEQAFFDAGCFIVQNVDRLIAIWDGERSRGFGGTADIVKYARDSSVPVTIIDPITRAVRDTD